MRSRALQLASLTALLTHCGSPTNDGETGAQVGVNIAALNLGAVGDVVWDIEVVNGRTTPGPDVVFRRRVASSTFGDGAGSANFVGPCDAAQGVSNNTVKLWVVGVYSAPVTTVGDFASGAAGGVVGSGIEFQNPTTTTSPISQTFQCAPNADVAVDFNVSLMRPANQGFFDIAVTFNDIFCSAKFDCCTPDSETGECASYSKLLFDAAGARSDTMVLGFACTGGVGAGVETELFVDAIELDCSAPHDFETGFVPDFTINPGGVTGNRCTVGANGISNCSGVVVENGALDADDYFFQIATYRGSEVLLVNGQPSNQMYWNVGLGVKHAGAGTPGIEDCLVRTRATAQPIGGTTIVGGNIDGDRVYPFVQWQVAIDECRQEPMSSEMVQALYSGLGDPVPFGYRFAQGTTQSECALACQNGGVCAGLTCACPEGYDGPACAGTVDHCAGVTLCSPGTCVSTLDGFHCDCPNGYDGDGTTSCALSTSGAAPGQGPGYVAPGDAQFVAPSLTPLTGSVTVTWGTIAGGSRYEIYRDGVFLVNGTGFSYNDTNLANGTHIYSYRVYDASNVLLGQSASSYTTTTNIYGPAANFGTNGVASHTLGDLTVSAMKVDSQGRVVIVGATTQGRAFITRFTAAGVLDTSFANTGTALPQSNAFSGAIGRFDSLVVMPDDSYVVGGEWSSRTNGYQARQTVLYRYLTNGTRDTSFGGVSDYNAYTCPGSTCGGGGPSAFDPGVHESITALTYDGVGAFYGFVTMSKTGALFKYGSTGALVGGFQNGIMVDPTLPTKRVSYYHQGVLVPGGGGNDVSEGLGVAVRSDGNVTFIAHSTGGMTSRPTWIVTVDPNNGSYVTQGQLTNDLTVTDGTALAMLPDGTTYFCTIDHAVMRALDGIIDSTYVRDPIVTNDFGCRGGLYNGAIKGVAGHIAFGLAPNGYSSFQRKLDNAPQNNDHFAAIAPDGDLFVVDRFNFSALKLYKIHVP